MDRVAAEQARTGGRRVAQPETYAPGRARAYL